MIKPDQTTRSRVSEPKYGLILPLNVGRFESENSGVRKVEDFLQPWAIEHNLIPCKILGLKKLMVKNGRENKIKTQICLIF